MNGIAMGPLRGAVWYQEIPGKGDLQTGASLELLFFRSDPGLSPPFVERMGLSHYARLFWVPFRPRMVPAAIG